VNGGNDDSGAHPRQTAHPRKRRRDNLLGPYHKRNKEKGPLRRRGSKEPTTSPADCLRGEARIFSAKEPGAGDCCMKMAEQGKGGTDTPPLGLTIRQTNKAACRSKFSLRWGFHPTKKNTVGDIKGRVKSITRGYAA